MVGTDPNQYLLYTDIEDFDYFWRRLSGREGRPDRALPRLPARHRPDVVHFQHTAYLGYDMVRVARNTLPDAPIVYSLHEYMPICHRDGEMVRATNDELCEEESPRRCHECFPDDHPAGLLHAQALHPVASRPGRPLHRPERIREGALCRLGHPGVEDRGRAAGIPPARSPRRASATPRAARLATASPISASSIPTRARTSCCARWTCSARTSTATCGIYGANLEKQSPRVAGAVRRAARDRARQPSPSPATTTAPSSAS